MERVSLAHEMKTKREKSQRKRRSVLNQQRADRIRMLLHEHKIDSEADIPTDAIPADLSNQKFGYSCSPLRIFYRDVEFTCKRCGRKEVWRAEDQQWYYEVAKGSALNEATRCHECRTQENGEQAGPLNP
jgi:predicted RNA-binding Zn-ribbon protein involved in translation (DUF1610 family)